MSAIIFIAPRYPGLTELNACECDVNHDSFATVNILNDRPSVNFILII